MERDSIYSWAQRGAAVTEIRNVSRQARKGRKEMGLISELGVLGELGARQIRF